MRSALDIRSEPGVTTLDPHLSLSCLGACRVTRDGVPVTGFRSQKALALLIYLAVEAEHPHRRQRLAGLFWPEFGEQAARHSLRQALANLRLVLGDEGKDRPYLLVTRDTVQFNSSSDHRLDLAMVIVLLDANERHLHHRLESCQACLGRLEQAVALYHGDFLQQLFVSDSAAFEEWSTIKREQLQQRVLEALRQLAAAHEGRGAYEQARQAVWRQLELAPWAEEAHRHLMRLLCLLGQPSAALAQYESCRRALDESLAVEPSTETTTLYEEIRASQSSTQPVPNLRLDRAPRHKLPAQPNSLVGREADLRALGEVIEDPGSRLVTLTGPGGIGKTRLALQGAYEHVDSFRDGVVFVSLALLNDPALVAPTIAHALGLEGSGDQPMFDRLHAYLTGKQLLLLLDNFEHVISAAPVVAELLRAAPRLEVLVTSREVLHLYGEHEFPVPPLVAPPIAPNGPGHAQAVSAAYPAVQLFVQRAVAVMHEFQLTSENAAVIGAICTRLDGLPLAIELAAVRVKIFSPQALLARLDQRLAWLTGGPRDHPARQRTLRATLDWSYNLLDADEQLLFTRLAVFAGGWTLEAAAAVCQADGDLLHTLDVVSSLVDKSLVQRMVGGDIEPRFIMLETIREYALERLAASSETGAFRRHAWFFLGLVEQAELQLRGTKQSVWLQRLETEHDNLRGALRWALDEDATQIGLRLVGSLRWFWTFRSHVQEGSRWAKRMLEKAIMEPPTAARAKALWTAGVMALFRHEADARNLLEESVRLWRVVGDVGGLGYALQHLGNAVLSQGDPESARLLEEESVALFRSIGDKPGMALASLCLGSVMTDLGDDEGAHVLFEESVQIARAIDDRWCLALALSNLAYQAKVRNDYAAGCSLLAECIAVWWEMGTKHEIARVLYELGQWTHELGDVRRATQIFGSVAALVEGIEALHAPGDYAPDLAGLCSVLGNDQFELLWQAGRAMSLEQVVVYAREAAIRDCNHPGPAEQG